MSEPIEFTKNGERYEWHPDTGKLYHWFAQTERNYTNVKATSLEEAKQIAKPT